MEVSVRQQSVLIFKETFQRPIENKLFWPVLAVISEYFSWKSDKFWPSRFPKRAKLMSEEHVAPPVCVFLSVTTTVSSCVSSSLNSSPPHSSAGVSSPETGSRSYNEGALFITGSDIITWLRCFDLSFGRFTFLCAYQLWTHALIGRSEEGKNKPR